MAQLALRLSFIVVLVLFYLLVEVAAKLYVIYGLDIRENDYVRLYHDDPGLNLLTWADDYRSHPYFGYAEPQRIRDMERIQIDHDDGDYVIAILGGSVAEAFGRYISDKPQLFQPLRQSITDINDRHIKIVNLAFGGHKQPQQFFVASYFIENVDLTINIEGFNEINSPDFSPLYPPDFPNFSPRFYPRDSAAVVYGWLLGAGRFSYRALNALPRRLPFLSRSSLYFLLWQVAHQGLYSAINGAENRYLSTVGITNLNIHEQGWMTSKERRMAIWHKYTRLEEEVARGSGVRSYFFLQPNQYLWGTKTLSDEERAVAIIQDVAEERLMVMKLARDAVKVMQAEGLPMFDLTEIYREIEEPVYKDACCHLNDLGNQIMAERVVATIEADLRDQTRKWRSAHQSNRNQAAMRHR